MNIFFSSRAQARSAKFGKLVDLGASAPVGKRYARQVEKATLVASLSKYQRS